MVEDYDEIIVYSQRNILLVFSMILHITLKMSYRIEYDMSMWIININIAILGFDCLW